MKILICAFYFPPAGGGGVQRPLKLAHHLPGLGVETHVLAPFEPKWIHRDTTLRLPPDATVHRVPFHGPRGRLPAEELYGRGGLDRLLRQLWLTPRRLLVPDENVTWNLSSIPHGARVVLAEGIDVVMTTSPPSSIHLTGAALKLLTGVRWIADLRDSMVANHDRRVERLSVQAKEWTHKEVARLVARSADAVISVTEGVAEEMRLLGAVRVAVIPNGCDFEDFAGLSYSPGDRFRIAHTGSFLGARDPRPFLTALAGSNRDVVARFVGDFRRADREWASRLELGDRLELVPYSPHRRALEVQRDSEALLLLLPEVGERGRDVPSGKLYEYLAAERPILAAVPPDGTAARLVREAGSGVVVPPGDVAAIRLALEDLEARWRAGTLAPPRLEASLRDRLSRRAQVEKLGRVLERVHESSAPAHADEGKAFSRAS